MSKLFFGGIPTKPEVDKLMGLLDGKPEGYVLPWKDIDDVIGEHGTNRARTVIIALKRRMHTERNILLVAVKGEGYRIADPQERVQVSSGMVTAGKRRIVKGAVIAASTDTATLNDEQRKTRDLVMSIPARLRLAELTSPKEIK